MAKIEWKWEGPREKYEHLVGHVNGAPLWFIQVEGRKWVARTKTKNLLFSAFTLADLKDQLLCKFLPTSNNTSPSSRS